MSTNFSNEIESGSCKIQIWILKKMNWILVQNPYADPLTALHPRDIYWQPTSSVLLSFLSMIFLRKFQESTTQNVQIQSGQRGVKVLPYNFLTTKLAGPSIKTWNRLHTQRNSLGWNLNRSILLYKTSKNWRVHFLSW
jgi:hypothetical protein